MRRLYVSMLVWMLGACSSGSLRGLPGDGGSEPDARSPDQDATSLVERPSAPTQVRASRDDPRAVTIDFALSSPASVDGFEVSRDGVRIASLPADARSFRDTEARPPVPSAPSALQASEGTSSEGVALSWERATPLDGPSHSYTVVAIRDGIPSRPGGPAEGFRPAAPIAGYEISRDDGRTWLAVDAEGGEFFDRGAPHASITPGNPRVEPLLQPDRIVRLTLVGLRVEAARSRYRVRALVQGTAGPPSHSAEGYRKPAPASVQWQYAEGRVGDAGSFRDLPEATGPSWFDSTFTRERPRTYRAAVRAAGAEWTYSSARSVDPLPGVIDVAFGKKFRCVVYQGGRLSCTGDSWGGIPEAGLAGPFKQITAEYTLCALYEDGRRQCWGPSDLGNGPPGISRERFVDVEVGEPLCMIRAADNLLRCSGTFSSYERNDYPRDVPARDVSVSDRTICMVEQAGPLRCWGAEESHSVGPTEAHYTQVHAHPWARGFCAVRDTGALECFEMGGELRDPLDGSQGLLFETVAGGLALTRDGRLFRYGQGLVDIDHRYVAIDGGCAVREDGELRCSTEPELRVLEGTFVDLRVGDDVCGIDKQGRAHCRQLEAAWAAVPRTTWEGEPQLQLREIHDAIVLEAGGRVHCVRNDPRDPDAVYPPEACLPPEHGYRSLASDWELLCGLRDQGGVIDCVRRRWPDPLQVGDMFPDRYSELAAHDRRRVCALRQGGGVQCYQDREPMVLSGEFSNRAASHLVVVRGAICALDAAGRAVCNSTIDPFIDPDRSHQSLVASTNHVCALGTEGRVDCWLFDSFGPRRKRWIGRYEHIEAGPHGVCGLRDDGKIVCDQPYGAWDGRSLVTP